MELGLAMALMVTTAALFGAIVTHGKIHRAKSEPSLAASN